MILFCMLRKRRNLSPIAKIAASKAEPFYCSEEPDAFGFLDLPPSLEHGLRLILPQVIDIAHIYRFDSSVKTAFGAPEGTEEARGAPVQARIWALSAFGLA
jgi:hypothetical protein